MARDALIPDQFFSDREYDRFNHLDVCDLEDTDLVDEFHALQPLLWGLDSGHWLRERVEALEAEISKRQGDTDRESRGQPKPKLAEGVEL